MLFDTSLLTTQLNNVRIKGKVQQSRESSCAFLSVVANEKRAFWSPLTKVANFFLLCSANYWLQLPILNISLNLWKIGWIPILEMPIWSNIIFL